MKGIRLEPGDIAMGREQFGVMQDWLFELWSATDMGKDGDYRKRLAELMDEIATLRSEVRFLLDHVGGLENASGLRLEDEDRRRYEAIAERYWGVIPD